jgi:hypothetical protein
LHTVRVAAALGLALFVAGCGSKPVAQGPGPTPTGQISPELILYAQTVSPTLKTTLSQLSHLISELQSSSDMDKLAFDCAHEGGALQADDTAVQGVAAPSEASSYYSDAVKGYSIALGASDTCAVAADARQPGDLASAARNFSRAFDSLNTAESGIAPWLPAP